MKSVLKKSARDPRDERRCARTCWSSTSAGRCSSPADPERLLRAAPGLRPRRRPNERPRASASRPWRGRSATCSPSAGSRPRETYDRENPKQVYYLSMEFLIGRSLANNIINLLVEPLVREAMRARGARPGRSSPRRSRTPAWATAAWAGWPPASSTRWPRCSIPAIGYGLRYEYGIFRQEIAGRPPGRAPRQLAAPSRPLGGRPAGRDRRGRG